MRSLITAAAVLTVSLAGIPAQAAGPPAEAQRVDRVPTPVLRWQPCEERFECATAPLPLDYDDPDGAQVEVALLRHRATDPARRIGSLFVNPGGPGSSATDMAMGLPDFLSPEVVARFDIVGVDPRGVGDSWQVRCFGSAEEQQRVTAPFTGPGRGPYTRAEVRKAVASARTIGVSCAAATGGLAAAASTAQVARDMDVLRRAVGDARLTYLGVSYGSYLGQVYAAMFPGRVRAIAIDGIVDPAAWAGTPATRDVPTFVRMGSAAASHRVLRELLQRCDRAGESRCGFAGGDFDTIAERLQRAPVTLPDGRDYTYPMLVSQTLQQLYQPDAADHVIPNLVDLRALTDPYAEPARREAARKSLAERLEPAPGGYHNEFEAAAAVFCSDGWHARDAASWPAAAAAA
ncbi:alpha/beta hydrolase, partial [Actinoplanes sp. NPDC024001]|uniref:alpha/beta hydrolase n=1 Tax=Actinoplanes sp. NPDC024001 TaxID=3154598 RepID=UPI0033E3B6DD